MLAVTLLVLAVTLAANAFRSSVGDAPEIDWRGTGKVGITLSLSIVFLVLAEVVDLLLLMPFLIAPIMMIMGERRPWVIVAVPVLFDAFVYLVFYRIFGVL